MSFSKAKIQRFNDIIDATPSPAHYVIKPVIGTTGKNGFLPQTERFPVIDLPSSSSVVSSENGSEKSTPVFRTPRPARKLVRKPLTTPKNGRNKRSVSSDRLRQIDRNEELREKIVECKNKDIYIAELSEQLDEFKEKDANLRQKCTLLETENEANRHIIELLNDENSRKLKSKKRSQCLIKGLKDKTVKIHEELTTVKNASKELKIENRNDLSKLLESIQHLEQIHNNILKDLNQDLEAKLEVIQMQKSQIESVENALHQLTSDHLNLVEIHRGSDLKNDFIRLETQSIFNWLQSKSQKQPEDEDPSMPLDDLMKSTFESVRSLFDLKESKLKEEKDEVERSKDNLNSLRVLYEKEVAERTRLEKDLTILQTKMDEAVNKTKTLKNYELALKSSHNTIEVLQKRLLESDRDVEQLKNELSELESETIQYESKNSTLNDLNADLELENEQKSWEIEELKRTYATEVNAFKEQLNEKVAIAISELRSKCEVSTELHQLLEKQQESIKDAKELIGSAQTELERVETECEHYKMENSVLTQQIQELQDLIHNEVNELRETILNHNQELDTINIYTERYRNREVELILMKNDLDTLSKIRNEYVALNKRYSSTLKSNEEYKKRVEEQESLIGPFLEQLKVYEAERKDFECETEELAAKYANILGHQNHKQKIRHVVDLKNRIEELKRTKQTLEHKLRIRNRFVEHLKRENSELQCKLKQQQKELKTVSSVNEFAIDKENSTSTPVNKSAIKIEANGTPIASPLRNRN